MKAIGVIPSRMGATRFPRKPLALIGGKPMIVRVWEQASKAQSLTKVIVATDNEEIASIIRAHGGEAVMTDSALPSGTDRCRAAVKDIEAEIVLNIQGDEPAIDPDAIDAIVTVLRDNPEVAVATPGVVIFDDHLLNEASAVKIVRKQNGDALYFSRASIPFPRNPQSSGLPPMLFHLGLYGYRRDALEWFAKQSPSPLELRESLEQLRFLEHGWIIRVVETKAMSFGVDTPNDVPRVEALLLERGLM